MIEVIVTSTNYNVGFSTTTSNITVTSDNTLFTVTNTVYNFTVTNYAPEFTFMTDGNQFDFVVKHRGEWESGATYTRNDVVRFENSIYICSIGVLDTLTSEFNPVEDFYSWELFYWNQWDKKYLTITGPLTVGGQLSVAQTGTFASDLSVGASMNVSQNLNVGQSVDINGQVDIAGDINGGGNLTIDSDFSAGGNGSFGLDLDVGGSFIATTGTFTTTLSVGEPGTTGTFYINGLRYPTNKGTYGQVLYTGGDETSQAAWVNLGELVFWSLSDDLITNGFKIVTGVSETEPNPSLTIGSGVTGALRSKIVFPEGGNTIDIDAISGVDISGGSNSIGLGQGIVLTGDTSVRGILEVSEELRGWDPTDPLLTDIPISIGEGGIRFNDGTVQITAGTGGFTSTQIATTTRLGVIRVGNYLDINTSSGILSVDVDSLPSNYTLPAASTVTRGGIRVGNGLTISNDGFGLDILNVTTSTEFGNVSLTQHMRTNGYLITYQGSGTNNILVSTGGVLISGGFGEIDVGDSITLTPDLSGKVISNAAITEIGADIYNSTMHVGRIYNYSGTGPPFFPAGTQYQDNTIQRTAWRGYDQGLIGL